MNNFKIFKRNLGIFLRNILIGRRKRIGSTELYEEYEEYE